MRLAAAGKPALAFEIWAELGVECGSPGERINGVSRDGLGESITDGVFGIGDKPTGRDGVACQNRPSGSDLKPNE